MKKTILASAFIVVYSLTGSAFAQEEPSMENCYGATGCQEMNQYDTWTSTSGKIYYTVDGNKMTIYGATSKDNQGNTGNQIVKYQFANNKNLSGITEIKFAGNHDYTIDNLAFQNASNITSVDLGGMQTVNGFSRATNLKNATLTNVHEIAAGAFEFTSLESLNLKDVQTIGSSAFEGTPLKSVNLENIGTIDSRAFSSNYGGNLNNLENVTLKNVDSIGASAFSGATVTNLTLENVDTIGDRAFQNLKNVETLNLTNIQNMDTAAFSSAKITTVNLKDMDTVSGFYYANIENVNLENVKKIGDGCFNNVKGLKSVDLNGVEEIGGSAFYGSSLESIDLTGVKKIGSYAFQSTTNLTDLVFSDSLESAGTNAFYNVKPTNLTINSDKINMFLNAGGSFQNIENIYCSNGADACKEYLSQKYKNYPDYLASLLAKVKDAPVKAKEEKMADGSIKMYQNGKFIGWKNKRIYTVQEANEVAGRKNKVMIRYK